MLHLAIGRILLIGSTTLFAAIAITAVIKKNRAYEKQITGQEKQSSSFVIMSPKMEAKQPYTKPVFLKGDLPCVDRIYQLFSKHPTSQFPIVETISYTSSVSWLAGRPAWLNDYADYYQTSSYFILRSLGAKGDYSQQRIVEGNRFNVFRRDKKIEFYLLVDISRCKMGFYYLDVGTNERILLKTYPIGLGRLDENKPSGSLTPLGRYILGKRVATYQLESKGIYQNKMLEMVTVFGTHWIPFEQEIGCSEPVKGYGLQGSPWVMDSNGQLVEDLACIGGYSSNGCIRLASKDIEEIFAIVITKPTFIEIVKDFGEATLPGIEVAAPSR